MNNIVCGSFAPETAHCQAHGDYTILVAPGLAGPVIRGGCPVCAAARAYERLVHQAFSEVVSLTSGMDLHDRHEYIVARGRNATAVQLFMLADELRDEDRWLD